jgi:hypothetical protein
MLITAQAWVGLPGAGTGRIRNTFEVGGTFRKRGPGGRMVVSDIYPALRAREVDGERTGQWRDRAAQAEWLITQARTGPRTVRVSEITQVLAALDEDKLSDQWDQLRRLADRAQQYRRRVAEQAGHEGLPLADPVRPYGVLVIEATRLMEEFPYACDVLPRHDGR